MLMRRLKNYLPILKKSGLYDNSVIVMYGDHYGISDNHMKAMSQIMGEEVGVFENGQLQRVPLLIHVPGVKGGTMHQFGGQIDLQPTLLHLLGIDTSDYVHFGTDLLSKDHKEVVPFRNGDFVTPTTSYFKGKYYDTETGEVLEPTKELKNIKSLVEMKLHLSDKVVNGDLLRFYHPDGFVKIDPSDYDYTFKEDENTTTPSTSDTSVEQ